MTTTRHEASPLALVRQAAGGPVDVAQKTLRLVDVLAGYAGSAAVDRKLQKLHRLGIVEDIPTRVQIAVGGVDMLRFWIHPAAADYYRSQGLDYSFHQLLRFLDEPASLTDPVGFFSTRDNIIGHVMQVVHANPVYDLQLLCMYDDGLDELEGQLGAMIAGTHPRHASIAAIVEEADYHERLLDFVRRWRADPTIPPLLRSNVGRGPFSQLEKTFGSLTTAMRYFRKMPTSVVTGSMHLLLVREVQTHLLEPA